MEVSEAIFKVPSPTLAFALLCLLSGILWYVFAVHETKARRFLKRFKGPVMVPLLGNAWAIANPETVFETVSKFPEKYGRRIAIVAGTHNILFVYHPDDIKTILKSTELITKGSSYTFVNRWAGNGLVFSDGSIWHTRRKLLNPAFSYKMNESFIRTFTMHARVLVDILKEKLVQGESEIYILSLFQRLTFATLSESVLGVEINSQRHHEEELFAAMQKISSTVAKRTTRPWLHPDLLFSISKLGRDDSQNIKFLHSYVDNTDFTKRNVGSSVKQDDVTSKESTVLLDLLLDAQSSGEVELNDDDIRAETNVFLFAGQETTAFLLFWTVMLLAAHPEIQQRAKSEIDSVFGTDNGEISATTQIISRLTYLSSCIKEALRLYPGAAAISRRVKTEFKLDADTVVPSGIEIVMLIYVAHRLPEFFPEPLLFRPSRHFPENMKGRHPCAYIPFSAGPRNCIGQRYALAQVKIVLTHVLRNFNIKPVDAIESVIVVQEIVTRPNKDARCKFELRK